ncbi:uncharacterized mitochondrial protein AtMg00310-like [Vicia villosa]|uniref:uncharacterized mitochondrial protein AtMg00310-like n=1 Tax=Vicia villosa TaxID=3911 RepID=UPI00273AF184|nr:uncharacterized mitochondrial protein AtMg00310-like [Vicia villosa]
MLKSFWRGGGNNNKGIWWLAWESLTYPKSEGGLGFRDIRAFKIAMVAKQVWNFMTNPNALISKFFRTKYFHTSSFLAAKIENNPSFVWRSLWKAREVFLLGCRWRIGDGSNIRVMNASWLRNDCGGWVGAPQGRHVYSLMVNSLFQPNTKRWDYIEINQLFPLEIGNAIL